MLPLGTIGSPKETEGTSNHPPSTGSPSQMLSIYEYVKYKEFGKVSMWSGRSGYICNTTNGIKTNKTSDSCGKLLRVGSSTAGTHIASMRITDARNVTVVEYQRDIDLFFIILASLTF